MTKDQPSREENASSPFPISPVSRRGFLNYAGLSAAALLVASSCQSDVEEEPVPETLGLDANGDDKPKQVVNLGSGDIAVLNYAYALEQLEAAFYTMAVASPYAGITAKELTYLTDIRDHEIAHREFLKNALGNRSIGGLILDFSSINFSSRASVLGTAKAFEDLGVAAYNGAGELLQSPDYLLIAGKIVSVEARHAAAIRDLLSYGSFADSTAVNEMGLDLYMTPTQVLAAASTYIKTKIITNNLPTA